MKILRSFPNEPPPPGRGFIRDDIERFPQAAFDYTGLKAIGDDVVILEWDIAVSKPDLESFAERVRGEYWPVVAPFLSRDGSQFMHFRQLPNGVRPIMYGEPHCDLFGFGLVYLPWWIIDGYPPGYGGSSIMSDGSLPRWLRENPAWKPIPVDWATTVVHIS